MQRCSAEGQGCQDQLCSELSASWFYKRAGTIIIQHQRKPLPGPRRVLFFWRGRSAALDLQLVRSRRWAATWLLTQANKGASCVCAQLPSCPAARSAQEQPSPRPWVQLAGKEKGHSPQKAAAAPALLPLAQEQPPPCSPGRCVTPAPCLAGGSEPLQMLGAVAACSGTRPPSRGMQQGDQHQGETPARRGNAASSTPARPPRQEDCHSTSLLGDTGDGTWPAVCAVLVRGRL